MGELERGEVHRRKLHNYIQEPRERTSSCLCQSNNL